MRRRGLIVASNDKMLAGKVGVATPVSRALQALLATGAAQWSGRKPVLLPQLVVPDPPVGVKSLADMVIEDRG